MGGVGGGQRVYEMCKKALQVGSAESFEDILWSSNLVIRMAIGILIRFVESIDPNKCLSF